MISCADLKELVLLKGPGRYRGQAFLFVRACKQACGATKEEGKISCADLLKVVLPKGPATLRVAGFFRLSPFERKRSTALNEKSPDLRRGLCAQDKIRTCTPVKAPPPQSGLSTNFNTWATLSPSRPKPEIREANVVCFYQNTEGKLKSYLFF